MRETSDFEELEYLSEIEGERGRRRPMRRMAQRTGGRFTKTAARRQLPRKLRLKPGVFKPSFPVRRPVRPLPYPGRWPLGPLGPLMDQSQPRRDSQDQPPPPSSSASDSAPPPSQGDQSAQGSEHIRWVQSSLNRILNLNLPVNGVMDAQTRSAVRSFQTKKNLHVDGIVGPPTERAIVEATTEEPSTQDPQPGANGQEPQQTQSSQEELFEFFPELEFSENELSLGSESESWEAPLPRSGANGCGCHGKQTSTQIPELETSFELEGEVGRTRQSIPLTLGVGGDPRIIDLTARADKSRRISIRPPEKVWALVLHQMACCFRVKDPLTRFLKMAPHFAILPDGRILQLHPLQALTSASNGFNAGSVAVEFAGNFPNTSGKWWLHKDLKTEAQRKANQNQVTPQQIESGRYLVHYLIRAMGLKTILAHRQSSGTRVNDPGPDIWYHVGQWAIDNLGLKDGGPGFKVGTGNPIPDLWRKWGQAKPQPELEIAGGESGERETTSYLPSAAEAWESEVNRSSSEYVRWVQQALNRISGLQLTVDGIAGVKTKSAIRSFQSQRGLVVDGIVGPKTEAALVAAGAGAAPAGSRSSATPTACPANTFVDCPVPGVAPAEVLDNFAHNDARLNRPRHMPLINNVARQIISSQNSPQPISSVLITGHTDPSGSDNFNFDLARRRAEAVARELCNTLGAGLSSKLKFNLTSCGERQLKATPELSRRVELFLPKPVPTPVQPTPSGQCNFRPSKHGLKFVNSFTLPAAVAGPLSKLGINVGSGGYGLCGGMSFLAADLFSFRIPVSTTSTVPSLGTSLYLKLLERQLDSLKIKPFLVPLGLVPLPLPRPGFGAPVLKFWVWMSLPDRGRGSIAQKTAAEIAIINPILRRSRFAVFGLVLVNRSGSLTDNHQVLAYCVTQRAPNDFLYAIYDPNYPLRDDIRIEVKIVRGEAQVFHVVPAHGGSVSSRTPVRGLFNIPYSPVKP